MLKALLAAALLITLIKLLLWCTAPLRSSRDTALDEDAREAWLKRRPKEQVQLSIVVPAYDEAERLPPTLRIMELYLRNRKKDDATFTFEIIVVVATDTVLAKDGRDVAMKINRFGKGRDGKC